MGRIIAIDVGQKRVGLAVTDPLGIIATGLDTVGASEVLDYLARYSENEKIDLFVVGHPRQMNNKLSESFQYVTPFLKRLKKMFPSIPVELVDERFTSKIAKKSMISAGASKGARKNKATVDRISAVILLQSYLEQEKFNH